HQAQAPLDKGDVYVFRMEISNDLEDSYHTRMDPATTLPNYVADFREGRSIQNSHKVEELPLARTFDAALEQRGTAGDPTDPNRTAVVIKGYVPRGLNLNGVRSDDLIRGIETGVVRDGSVHFDDAARYVCNLCGADMYERESSCPHMPGLTYGGKRAGATIVEGHALEASLVYDGSTPHAMIDKAQRMAAAGLLEARQVDRIERILRTRIKAPHVKEETTMSTEDTLLRIAVHRRRGSPLDNLDPDTASAVQDQLQKLVASHAQHGSTLQTLGGIIGTGIGVYRGRAGAGPFAPVPTVPTGKDVPPVAQVNPILKAVHENLVAEHDAHGEALKTLLSLVGVGPDFGLQTGTPDRPASINDMDPKSPLTDFHGDLSMYQADPTYPALSTVPAKVVDNGRPGVNPLGRSRRMSNVDQFKTGGHPLHGGDDDFRGAA
ncbi:MAG TPA: hypothetical protein VKD46_07895, partial [bacterium]|nr:hypothetical protein [bacterium]